MSYKIVYSKDAVKDIQKLQRANLATKAKALIEVIRNNPYQTPRHMKNWLVICLECTQDELTDSIG